MLENWYQPKFWFEDLCPAGSGSLSLITDCTTSFDQANPTTDRTPASITRIGRPSIHRLGAAKNRRAPAKPRKNPTAVRSAAVPGRINPMTNLTLVSFTQIWRPSVHRLGAGKNARAPADAGKGNGAGSAAVPGRINPMANLTPVSFTQIWRPSVHRLGAGKNARAPA
ncbi:MAG: hypothetical protein GX456_13490, partial [Verrucomicrobia bacterium]|nr:hypothetical protein [Verrucomicrobiota bacterium]